jgi:superfamily II DNA or RNA helicase
MKPLRDYQVAAIDALTKAVEDGRRRVILRAPTGAGKTRIAREIVDRCVTHGAGAVFVAPRNEIIGQTSEELKSAGIKHVVLQANHPEDYPVKVASTATLARREVQSPAVLFLDEAHLWLDVAKKLVARFPDSIVVGLTATPERLDGRGLGEIYEEIIGATETRDLIALKYLVPARVFGPSQPSMNGVRTTAGDYNRGDLAMLMDRPRIVGDIVATWKKLADGRSTIVYAAGVEASLHLRDAFRAAGVNAEHVDAETPTDVRAGVVDRLRDGSLPVVCNVELFTYGLDVPRVSCISMARPTKSLALYLQMTGRGLRPFPEKDNLIVLDHAGNALRHGLPDFVHEWKLDGAKSRKRGVGSLRTCKRCFAIFLPHLDACPECGAVVEKKVRQVDHVDGELLELQPVVQKVAKWSGLSDDAKIRAFAKWLRTKSESQAYAIYYNCFGARPTPFIARQAQRLNEYEKLPSIAVPLNVRS